MTPVSEQVIAAQWALIVGLGILVVIMYRQLAYFLRIGKSTSRNAGIDPGESAPAFNYRRVVSGDVDGSRIFDPGGRPVLLMFADPSCGACEAAMLALERLRASASKDDLEILVMTDENPALIAAVDGFRDTSLELGLIKHDVAAKQYLVNATPIVFGIGRSGKVVLKRAVGTYKEMKSVMRQLLAAEQSYRPDSSTRSRVTVVEVRRDASSRQNL